MKIIICRGLPGAGKTTWARRFIDKNPNTKRINKDDLRAMLDDGKYSKENEKFVISMRDFMIIEAIQNGFEVIIDDTNLNPQHIVQINAIIARINESPLIKQHVELEIKDFTDVSLDECIKRDQKRSNYVGEKVIRDMYNKYLKPTPPVVEHDPSLPNAVICDLDGTLALFGDRNPYERDFENDILNEPVAHILRTVHQTGLGAKIIFVSGRKNKFRKQTEEFLKKNDFSEIIYEALYMPRADTDNRNDTIIKREAYEQFIKEKYNILFVLDDRLRVCRLWHALGLSILRVGDPDADF